MKIAIDLNGGDHAPKAVIKGIELALKRGYFMSDDIAAVGTKHSIAAARREKNLAAIEMIECQEEILMGDKKADIIRRKRSTIAEGLRGVKAGKFSAFVSAGNTAGMVMWGVLILSRLKRRLAPAIAVPLPNESGPCLLLDAGAIHDATSHDLVNCAAMGSIYARRIWNIDKPIVRLLNIGSEGGKGNDSLRLTDQLLSQMNSEGKINYGGNIEGDAIFLEPANVIVCAGEIGNNTIKVAEGVKKFIERKLGCVWKLISFFYSHHKKTDYQEVGGAILLGVNGIEIIAHGKSQPLAIANAIRRAKMEVEADIIGHIKAELASEPEDGYSDDEQIEPSS